jgi:hypothetical protein
MLLFSMVIGGGYGKANGLRGAIARRGTAVDAQGTRRVPGRRYGAKWSAPEYCNPPAEIGRRVGASRPTICKRIDKALVAGVRAGSHNCHHRPHVPQIIDAPKALGLAAELWTLSALAAYVGAYYRTGHPHAWLRRARAPSGAFWRVGEASPSGYIACGKA